MNINLTLIAQAVMFALFIWFTASLVWPYLARAIETRQKDIADGLAAAERGRHDLELASKRSADVLREAKDRAAHVAADADKEVRRMIDEAKAAAKQEAEKVYNAKLAELNQEAERTRSALRERVVELALAGAEKILRREVDAKAHDQMLSALKQEL
jgi:F-type H+-transporting ATPase subunit b